VQPILISRRTRFFSPPDSASPPCHANYRARYNIAPRQEHFIVRTKYEHRTLLAAKWGLSTIPGKQGRERYSINARAESVEIRPIFAEAFTHRRCVIPASGFYEWAGPSYARLPYWIHRRDNNLLLFAGLYSNENADDHGVTRKLHHPHLCREPGAGDDP
jgi:putative SOS response-associated peptidase YedK